MDHRPSPSSAGRQLESLADQRLPLLAFAVIVLSLALLVVVPLLVQRRSNGIWREIQTLEEAREQTRQWSFFLTREMSLLRGYLVEGDTILLRLRQENREAEAEASVRLAALTSPLSEPVRARFEEARDLTGEWHRRVDAELATSITTIGTPNVELFERTLYERALQATVVLREELAAAADEEAQRLAMAGRSGLAVELILGLLALVAAALVIRIGRRLREAGREARRLHDEALRAIAARSRLLRGISHDLKNPLGAADLYGQLLHTGAFGPLEAKQADGLARMRHALAEGIGLVQDLAELGRAESGHLELRREPVTLAEILTSLERELAARAEVGRLSLEVRPVDPQLRAFADPRRVRQILENLIGNAINYTPPAGRVVVEVHASMPAPRPDAAEWIAITVTDTGAGIPPDQLETVFEEFVRLPGTAVTVQGTGIGLAISRHLARAMDGDVTLRSEIGAGSVFTLWLPAAESRRSRSAPPHLQGGTAAAS